MKYTLIRSRRRTLGLEVRDEGIIVRAPIWATRSEIENFISSHRRWIENRLGKLDETRKLAAELEPLTEADLKILKKKAREYIPERVAYYAPLVGVSYGTISIRCQKTRWGSCSAKGNLNFNCLLMLTPPEVIDSVVVHELCHRKEMNHSGRFYEEVLRVFPDYRKWDKWLKEKGRSILMRVK